MCADKRKYVPIKGQIKGPRIVRYSNPEITPKPLTKKQQQEIRENKIAYENQLQQKKIEALAPEIDTETKLIYKNRKGNKIEVTATNHARYRFMHRWKEAKPDLPNEGKKHSVLAKYFNDASIMKSSGTNYENRRKRYGEDTLYFKNDLFVFIVQSAQLRTVEILCGGDLNKYWVKKKSKKITENAVDARLTCSVFAWLETSDCAEVYVPCGKLKIENFKQFRNDQDVIEQVRNIAIERRYGVDFPLIKRKDIRLKKLYAQLKQSQLNVRSSRLVAGIHFVKVDYF